MGTVTAMNPEWIVSLSVAGLVAAGFLVTRLRRRAKKADEAEDGHSDIEAYISPLTGEPLGRRNRKNVYDRRPDDAVMERQGSQVTDGTAPAEVEAPLKSVPVQVPQLGSRDVTLEFGALLLHAAWRTQDLEELLIHAHANVPTSDAASVLAAAIAAKSDRADVLDFLMEAYVLTAGQTQLAALQGFGREIVFQYEFPRWGLAGAVSEPVLGVAIATAARLCARGETGDVTQAYWMVSALPETPLAAVVKLVLLAEMQWWQEIADFDMSLLQGTPFYSVGCFVAGVAAGTPESGNAEEGFKWFGRALESLESGNVMGGDKLRHLVLVERALLHSRRGEVGAAWEDLLQVSAENPQFPGLRDLLKRI